MSSNEFIKYWEWFFKGSGGKSGLRRLINCWLIFHIFIGFGLSLIISQNLKEIANTVLLPLIGIFIGLSFAWAGNAQALMQSSEIDELSKFHKGGFVDYVFTYQTAILAILITLVFWALAGMSVFDCKWLTMKRGAIYLSIKVILFTLSSLTLRECWHVVLGAQWMLLAQREIKKIKNKQSNSNKNT